MRIHGDSWRGGNLSRANEGIVGGVTEADAIVTTTSAASPPSELVWGMGQVENRGHVVLVCSEAAADHSATVCSFAPHVVEKVVLHKSLPLLAPAEPKLSLKDSAAIVFYSGDCSSSKRTPRKWYEATAEVTDTSRTFDMGENRGPIPFSAKEHLPTSLLADEASALKSQTWCRVF